MNQAKQDKTVGQEESEHEAKDIRKRMLEIGMYVCGFFFAVGGLWLSYLGIFGHVRSQKVLALSVMFAALFFLLVGGYLYFLKQALGQGADVQPHQAETKKAYVYVSLAQLKKPLKIGEMPEIQMTFQNGPTEIKGKLWQSSYYIDWKPFKNSFEYVRYDPTTFTMAPSQAFNGEVRHAIVLTKEIMAALQREEAHLYFFTPGEFQDETGTIYPLNLCSRWDKHTRNGEIMFCFDTTKVTEKKIERGRPALGIEYTQIDLKTRPITTTTSVRNYGEAQAVKAAVFTGTVLHRVKFEQGPCTTLDDINIDRLPRFDEVTFEPFEAKNYTHNPAEIDAKSVSAVKSGRYTLYLFATMRYEHVSGKRFFTTYYGRYNPNIGVFEKCDINNSVDY